MKLALILWTSFIFGCGNLKSGSECKLVDRIEESDALILIYSCGKDKELVCRVHGNKSKGCKKYLSIL
jgi:hypothetical protein